MRKIREILPQFDSLNVPEQKKVLRKMMIAQRASAGLPVDERGPLQAQAALKWFSQLKLKGDWAVASFLPLPHEFELNATADESWIFPYIDTGNCLRWFSKTKDLAPNRFGILEPPREATFEFSDLKKFVLVFVPSLTVDAKGFRLGYGKGFYDRFLNENRQKVVSVCCTHSQFLFDTLPTEDHDSAVDALVTEEKIIEISSQSDLVLRLFGKM